MEKKRRKTLDQAAALSSDEELCNRFVFTNDTVLASLQNQSTAVFNY